MVFAAGFAGASDKTLLPPAALAGAFAGELAGAGVAEVDGAVATLGADVAAGAGVVAGAGLVLFVLGRFAAFCVFAGCGLLVDPEGLI